MDIIDYTEKLLDSEKAELVRALLANEMLSSVGIFDELIEVEKSGIEMDYYSLTDDEAFMAYVESVADSTSLEDIAQFARECEEDENCSYTYVDEREKYMTEHSEELLMEYERKSNNNQKK